MGSEEALWALRGAQGDDDDPPTHPLPALAMPAKCSTDGAALVNERSVVCGREGLSVVLSIAHQVMAHTFSSRMHYRRSVALLVVCGACRLDIVYPPSLRTGRQDRPGTAQVRVASKAEEVDVGKLATHPQPLMVSVPASSLLFLPQLCLPLPYPPFRKAHASVQSPSTHPRPLTTRTSARILRLRGEARSFASGGEPTRLHLYGTSAVFPRGFQPNGHADEPPGRITSTASMYVCGRYRSSPTAQSFVRLVQGSCLGRTTSTTSPTAPPPPPLLSSRHREQNQIDFPLRGRAKWSIQAHILPSLLIPAAPFSFPYQRLSMTPSAI